MYNMINKKTKCHFSLRKKLLEHCVYFYGAVLHKKILECHNVRVIWFKAEPICEMFNEQAPRLFKRGVVVPTIIFINQNKDFFLEYESPSIFQVSNFIWKFRRYYIRRRRYARFDRRLYQIKDNGDPGNKYFTEAALPRYYAHYNRIGTRTPDGNSLPLWFSFCLPKLMVKNKWFRFLYNLIDYVEDIRPRYHNMIEQRNLNEQEYSGIKSEIAAEIKTEEVLEKKVLAATIIQEKKYINIKQVIQNKSIKSFSIFPIRTTHQYIKASDSLDTYNYNYFKKMWGVQNTLDLENDIRLWRILLCGLRIDVHVIEKNIVEKLKDNDNIFTTYT
jgi:hypothetical protein